MRTVPIALRFVTDNDGRRLLVLSDSDTGRPLNYLTGLKVSYEHEQGGYHVKAEFFIPPEVPREGVEAYSSTHAEEDIDEYDVGFRQR
jgi:hypothetical protein